jgi:hypothetical protein
MPGILTTPPAELHDYFTGCDLIAGCSDFFRAL